MLSISDQYASYMFGPKVFVSIKPYKSIDKVLHLFPWRSGVMNISADFSEPSIYRSFSAIRWGGILHEVLVVAKFLKTYSANRALFSDYEVVIDNKFFMGNLKYSIDYDPNYHNNGKKGKIKISTGQAQNDWGGTYLAGEKEIADNYLKRMYKEIGLAASSKHCQEYSQFADAE